MGRRPKRTLPLPEHFLSFVKKGPGCWLWTGARHRDTGYGQFSSDQFVATRAHRASWELFKGEIPVGLCVLHRCDVRLCVRPSHLFLGTFRDNFLDMVKKGRGRGVDKRSQRK